MVLSALKYQLSDNRSRGAHRQLAPVGQSVVVLNAEAQIPDGVQ